MKKKLFALLLALGLLTLCACGASKEASPTDMATAEMAYAGGGDYEYGWDNGAVEEVVEEADFSETAPQAPAAAGTALDENANYMANLKIIKTGNLTIQTEQFEETDAMIREKVTAYQGILAESSISGTAGYRFANYTVRIPSTSFDAFFYDIAEGNTVTYQNISAEDVTEYYTDISTRLTTAQKKYDRLLELLDQAETLTDIYSIQSEIADVEYEIDSLTGTKNGLDSRISYSTIYIEVDEKSKVTAMPEDTSFGAELLASIQNGTSGAVEFLQDLILFLAETWFFWLIAIILVLLVRHRIIKRRRENPRKRDRESTLKRFRTKKRGETLETPENTAEETPPKSDETE